MAEDKQPEEVEEVEESTDALTLDDLDDVDSVDEQEEAELEPDPGTAPRPAPNRRTGQKLTGLQQARAVMNKATDAVNDARRALDEALAAQQEACKEYSRLESEMRESVSLHDLNRVQREVTRVEDARRFRAAQALDSLARNYNPGKRNYPPVQLAQSGKGK